MAVAAATCVDWCKGVLTNRGHSALMQQPERVLASLQQLHTASAVVAAAAANTGHVPLL
jgi:hypothetical protein